MASFEVTAEGRHSYNCQTDQFGAYCSFAFSAGTQLGYETFQIGLGERAESRIVHLVVSQVWLRKQGMDVVTVSNPLNRADLVDSDIAIVAS